MLFDRIRPHILPNCIWTHSKTFWQRRGSIIPENYDCKASSWYLNILSTSMNEIIIKAPNMIPGLYVSIEGYWISAGENIPVVNEDFILTETVRQNLKDVARVVSLSKFAVLLQGETSVGKTRQVIFFNYYLTDGYPNLWGNLTDFSISCQFKKSIRCPLLSIGCNPPRN
jgi:hypothetical protein